MYLSGIFDVEEVLNQVRDTTRKKVVLGSLFIGKSETLRIFAKKGTKCDVCGRQGVMFKPYKETSGIALHLVDINNVKFGRDHVIPKCVGGKNTQANQVTMCEHCNTQWKSKFDVELKMLTEQDKRKGIILLVDEVIDEGTAAN